MRYRLILIAFFVSSSLFGQEVKKQYSIRGVDDSLRYAVTVEEDLVNDVTIVSLSKDAIKIFGVRGIESIEVHVDTFLKIDFRIRGGSGVKMRRKVLLCVSHNKMHKALDILSEITSRVTEVYSREADSLKLFDEKQDYHTTLSIHQKEGNRYKAILFESTKVESKYNPSQNVSFEKPYELDFDTGGYFFYNSVRPLNKRYKLYSSKDNKTTEKFINAEVPCIELHQDRYLFIDNEWYMDNGQDLLSCL